MKAAIALSESPLKTTMVLSSAVVLALPKDRRKRLLGLALPLRISAKKKDSSCRGQKGIAGAGTQAAMSGKSGVCGLDL